MRLVKFSLMVATIILLAAIIIDSLPSAFPESDLSSCSMSWIPYPERNVTAVLVRVDDVYSAGLSRAFHVLGSDSSPLILREGGELPFRNAVISALSRNASEITPEQYFYAADLAGFLRLKKLNFTEYFIVNPTEPFVLKLEGAEPSSVNVTYPPSAEIDGVEQLGVGKFRVRFHGYNGERAVKLKAICDGERFEKTIERKSWNWYGTLNISLSVDTSNCAGVTEHYCKFYVEDTLVLNLDRVYRINRSFTSGSFYYYYEAKCEWTVCVRDCSTGPEGRECTTTCWTECDPCSPIERYDFTSASVPGWAKRELKFRPNPAAEEYLIRAYADAIVRATKGVALSTLDNIEDSGKWELYFGALDRAGAERLLRYFYLVQLPLNVKTDESAKTTRLEAILEKRANCSVVSSLYTLFENATYINVTQVRIPFLTRFGVKGEIETNVIFVNLGSGQKFTRDYLKTDCGELAVAELAYYRQPALQNFRGVIASQDELLMRKGYSQAFGVAYSTQEIMCRVSR